MKEQRFPLDLSPEEQIAEALELFELAEIKACAEFRWLRGVAKFIHRPVPAGHIARGRVGVRRARRRFAIRSGVVGRGAGRLYVVLRRGDEVVRLPYA